MPIALIATKRDLEETGRSVQSDLGEYKKKSIGQNCFIFREVSSFDDDTSGIQDLFRDAALEVLRRRDNVQI